MKAKRTTLVKSIYAKKYPEPPQKLQHLVSVHFLTVQGLLNNISKVDLWGLTGTGLTVMLQKLTLIQKCCFSDWGIG